MKITILIFDLGGVVLTNDWHYDCPEKFQAYSDYFSISYDDMENGWNTYWPKFLIGKITEDEFWKGFLENAGAKKIDIEKARSLWRQYQKPIENMLDLLRRLKENYRLAALTTISKEWLDFKRKKFNLDNYFEVIVSSGYSGLAKPDPRIYDLILKELGVNGKECLYTDDSQQHLPPAENKGMKTILFKNQEDLKERFGELGIKF